MHYVGIAARGGSVAVRYELGSMGLKNSVDVALTKAGIPICKELQGIL